MRQVVEAAGPRNVRNLASGLDGILKHADATVQSFIEQPLTKAAFGPFHQLVHGAHRYPQMGRSGARGQVGIRTIAAYIRQQRFQPQVAPRMRISKAAGSDNIAEGDTRKSF